MESNRKIYYEHIDYIYASCKSYSTPRYMVAQHYHNAYELYYICEGTKDISVNNNLIRLNAGEMIVISPYAVHYTMDCGAYSSCIAAFQSKILSPILSQEEIDVLFKDICTFKYKFSPEHAGQVHQIMLMIERYAHGTEILSDKLAYTHIIQLVKLLQDLPKEEKESLGRDRYSLRPDIIRAIEYMHENYMSNMTLNDMLEYVHMSKSRFSELFKEATQMTFLQYLNLIRSSQAANMLRRTRTPLPEIAKKNGFSTSAHMSRVFKEVYGVSPSKFRNSLLWDL